MLYFTLASSTFAAKRSTGVTWSLVLSKLYGKPTSSLNKQRTVSSERRCEAHRHLPMPMKPLTPLAITRLGQYSFNSLRNIAARTHIQVLQRQITAVKQFMDSGNKNFTFITLIWWLRRGVHANRLKFYVRVCARICEKDIVWAPVVIKYFCRHYSKIGL